MIIGDVLLLAALPQSPWDMRLLLLIPPLSFSSSVAKAFSAREPYNSRGARLFHPLFREARKTAVTFEYALNTNIQLIRTSNPAGVSRDREMWHVRCEKHVLCNPSSLNVIECVKRAHWS